MKISVSVLAALLLLAPLASAQEKPRAQVYYIPSHSMEPTLNINDRIWTTSVPYQQGEPKRGDLAIIELSSFAIAPWAHDTHKTAEFVKRIIALPGDRVEMVKNVLKLNGQIQKEPFVKWDANYRYDMKVVAGQVYSREYDVLGEPASWTCHNVPVTEKQNDAISRAKTEALPPRTFVVLGDHRSNSNDSHAFGLVGRANIKAKVTMRIYPHPRLF